MGKIIIKGNKPLRGELTIQGSKNSVLPMMAAALLHDGLTILHNCPKITDVQVMIEILRSLGVKVKWENHSLFLDCKVITETKIDAVNAGRMRSSVILLGSLLGRKGEVQIGSPGGCVIGKRPIDLHILALEKLGGRIWENETQIQAFAPNGLQGATIFFTKSSVGATENALLAAVKAKGISRLVNCSLEPEIIHLCHFLKVFGAKIEGIGTSELVVWGAEKLKDIEYWVPADRIVAGTYLYSAAITRGNVALHRAPVNEMEAVLRVYEKMGGQWTYNSGKLVADARNIKHPISYLETANYPGFPTDMQSILLAVLLTIPGVSCIRETIFEERFQVVWEFIKMGARIQTCGKEVRIAGGYPLFGRSVHAQELRGGAALVLAGLAAQDTTTIQNVHYIGRGYENIVEDLSQLGGKIYLEEEQVIS